MRTWPPETVRSFLEHVSTDRLSALFTLAVTTGLRRGELLAVRWKDIDLDAGRLTVAQELLDVNHKMVFGPPKSGRSKRTGALDPLTVAALREHKQRQAAEIMAFGAPTGPTTSSRSPAKTASRSTPHGSRGRFSSASGRRGCPPCGCTICATAMCSRYSRRA